jgi:hypothetical protein
MHGMNNMKKPTPLYSKNCHVNIGLLKRCFLSNSLLKIKEIAQSVHLELQRRMLHVWTVIARLAGKFQLSYKSSKIHSAFVVASPGRH